MYQFLRGIITDKITEPPGSEKLILDVNGFGFEINTTLFSLSLFGEKGEISKVYTSLVSREDSQTLFGFPTLLERELFKLLCSVSGIGPRTALNLLNSLTVCEISYAILNEDTSILCKAQGVGERTALRVILELKSKIQNWEYLPIAQSERVRAKEGTNWRIGETESEARSVLQSLGYSKEEINKAFSQAKSNGNYKDPEALVQFCLKWLALSQSL